MQSLIEIHGKKIDDTLLTLKPRCPDDFTLKTEDILAVRKFISLIKDKIIYPR